MNGRGVFVSGDALLLAIDGVIEGALCSVDRVVACGGHWFSVRWHTAIRGEVATCA
jgi:hypothetical protein